VNLSYILVLPDAVPTAMLLPNIVGVELIALPVSISHFLSPSLKSKE